MHSEITEKLQASGNLDLPGEEGLFQNEGENDQVSFLLSRSLTKSRKQSEVK